MLSAGQYEFLPCFLHVLEDAQIGLQIISGGGLDVGMPELPRDHADVGSGLDRQRAERMAQVAWRHTGEFHALAPTAVVVCHLVRVQTADQPSAPAVFQLREPFDCESGKCHGSSALEIRRAHV